MVSLVGRQQNGRRVNRGLSPVSCKAIELTREQQYLIYMAAIKTAYDRAARKYSDYVEKDIPWNDLDSKIRDTLTDMQYRGDFRNISANTTEKATTPFDDVAFAKEFRDAVSTNDVGAVCRVMSKNEWKEKSAWNVPDDRFLSRKMSLLVNGECPP